MSKEEREVVEKEYVGISFYAEDIINDDINTKDGKVLTKVYAGDGKHFLVNNDYIRQSKENKDCFFITGLTKESYLYLEWSKKEDDTWKDMKEKISAVELKEMMKKVGFTITKKQAHFHEGERGGFVSIILPQGTERSGYVYTVNERQVRESEKNKNLFCVRMFAKEVHKARKYEEREVVDEVLLTGDMLRICYDEAFKYSIDEKEEKQESSKTILSEDTPFKNEEKSKSEKKPTKEKSSLKKSSKPKEEADEIEAKIDDAANTRKRGRSR